MNKILFMHIVDRLSNKVHFFCQKKDGLGRLGLSALQKCIAAIRLLAYGRADDTVDEYLRLGGGDSSIKSPVDVLPQLRSLLRFLEARNVRRGDELISVDMPLIQRLAGAVAVEVGLGGGFGGVARPQSDGRRKGQLLGLDLDAGSGFLFFRSPVLLPRRRRVTQWVTSYTTDLPECGGVKNGGAVRSFDGKGLVLRFSVSVRRKAPCPRTCQPVMCTLLWYAVRLYFPAPAVIPPVV
ncbi:hypothetical protein Bca4012_025232 [Brassica carinata]